MTSRQLLAVLMDNGITLSTRGGKLRFYPDSKVGPDLMALIKDHKTGLISLLYEYRDAIQHAFSHPSAPSDIGPDWMTDDWPDPLVPAKTVPGACDRCGSDQYEDFPIHGGQSIRRDCAQCGLTLGFSKWNPPIDRES